MKYETKDLNTASALFSQGHECRAEIVGAFPNGKNKYLFVFETEEENEELQLFERIEKINRGEMNVNLEDFIKAYQRLKNLTFQ